MIPGWLTALNNIFPWKTAQLSLKIVLVLGFPVYSKTRFSTQISPVIIVFIQSLWKLFFDFDFPWLFSPSPDLSRYFPCTVCTFWRTRLGKDSVEHSNDQKIWRIHYRLLRRIQKINLFVCLYTDKRLKFVCIAFMYIFLFLLSEKNTANRFFVPSSSEKNRSHSDY